MEHDKEADKQPDAPYSTSPMDMGERIGPHRADSAYGGAENEGAKGNNTDFSQDPAPDVQQHGRQSMGTAEQGTGLSSGAGQSGAGYQAGPRPEGSEQTPDFRDHYNAVYGDAGAGYEQYVPAYHFGYALGHDKQYYGRRWTEIEPGARRDWEANRPAQTWDSYREAIRHGWEQGSSGASNPQAGDEHEQGGQPSRLNRPSYQGPEDRRI